MANKLFSQGSIIYFQLDGAEFPQNDLCNRTVVVQVAGGSSPVYRVKSPMIGEHDILLSALTTKDGTAYTKASLDAWISSTLGEEINGGQTTYNSGGASTTISVESNTQRVVHQTKQRFNYQSGESLLSIQNMYGFQPQAGVTKRIGYFSSSTVSPFTASLDGWFLESTESGVTLNVYKSGTPTADALPQADKTYKGDRKLIVALINDQTIDSNSGLFNKLTAFRG